MNSPFFSDVLLAVFCYVNSLFISVARLTILLENRKSLNRPAETVRDLIFSAPSFQIHTALGLAVQFGNASVMAYLVSIQLSGCSILLLIMEVPHGNSGPVKLLGDRKVVFRLYKIVSLLKNRLKTPKLTICSSWAVEKQF